MGKSLDLPDPLESSVSQPLGNADDLLAQLAGEEVDRLLAEADAEGQQPPRPGEGRRTTDSVGDVSDSSDRAAPAPAPAPAPEAAIQNQLDALFTEINADQPSPEPGAADASAPGPDASSAAPIESETPNAPGAEIAPAAPAPMAPAPVAPIAPAPFSPVTSQLPDDIDASEVMAAILGDAGLSGSATANLPPIEPRSLATTSRPPADDVASGIVPARRPEFQTSAAERQGLSTLASVDALPSASELEILSAPVEDDAPLPAYLKPLEWINAPLDLLPTPARDVLGQIAILTLVNAIAVLIYVFAFRNP